MSKKLIEAAKFLRFEVGRSKNWGLGWLMKGDDPVLQACRDFDAALKAVGAEVPT